jgi:1-acyl-sn-glycerol-3-phosphate acyltransferase
LEIVALLILIGVFLAATGVGLLLAPFSSRRRPLRIAAFGLTYFLTEIGALVALAALWLRRPHIGPWHVGSDERWRSSHQALLAWTLGRVLAAARVCAGFRLVVNQDKEAASLFDEQPILALARHGGPGDSFALVHLLLTQYRRGVRIVLKEILQLDPVLDLLLNRLGSYFLPSRHGAGEDLAERLGEIAGDLRRREVLLIFPEGANWTPARRHRSITHLRRHGDAELARAAVLMTNVLPPRMGGVLACLESRPDLPVVVLAHTGLDRLTRARQIWEQLPFAAPMSVRSWSTAPPPVGEDPRRQWLLTEWAVVDEWIEMSRATPGDTAGTDNG